MQSTVAELRTDDQSGEGERVSHFRSFFQGGFECSTHRRPSGRRIDVIDATGHDRFAAADYARLAASELRTARDGLRWHLIEARPGEYDFSSVQAQVSGARRAGVQVIWDLLHYGVPDHIDYFSPEFPEQFARYAAAAAAYLRPQTDGELWLCPVNEISFLAWGGGDVGYLNPFAHGRGGTLKVQLVRAAILAMNAARDIDPGVRFLHAEPLISVSPHPEYPLPEAAAAVHASQYEALDMLAGRLRPELGGHPDYLDVIGLNFYPYNQWRHHHEGHLREVLPPEHPDYRPLRLLLDEAYARYGRPLLVAETGTEDEARTDWFVRVAREALAARAAGVPVQGVCLYPVVNHPGWDDDRHCHNGLWDYPDLHGNRASYAPLAAALSEAQVRYRVQQAGLPLPELVAPTGDPLTHDPLPDALRRLAGARPIILAEAGVRDADGQFPQASFAALSDAGLLRAVLPRAQGGLELSGLELGGLGLRGPALLHLLRAVGAVSLPVGRVYEGHLNALLLILAHGNPAQRAQATADAGQGELFGVWNTEEAPGLRLERADDGEWMLQGGKTFASGAGHVTRPLLPAELPGGGGRVMVLLPSGREPGTLDRSFWTPLGMRPTVSARVDYSGARVRDSDLIGPPGAYYGQPEFGGGALRFLAVQLGGAAALFGAARQVVQRLGRQHDDVQRLRFAGLAAGLEAAWRTVLHAAQGLESGAWPEERLLAYVALARQVTEDACLAVCEGAERAVGARGLLAPSPAERLLRDLRMYLRQPAPDAARLALGHYLMESEAELDWDAELSREAELNRDARGDGG